MFGLQEGLQAPVHEEGNAKACLAGLRLSCVSWPLDCVLAISDGSNHPFFKQHLWFLDCKVLDKHVSASTPHFTDE